MKNCTSAHRKKCRAFNKMETGVGDVSLLRQPMHSALKGFLEPKRAFENGTHEVRRLLVNECSFIYECNVCRNLFRSIVNFISHKRAFCRNSTCSSTNNNTDQTSSIVIQEPHLEYLKQNGSSPSVRKMGHNSKSDITQDLSKVIERLKIEQTAEESEKGEKSATRLERMPETLSSVHEDFNLKDSAHLKTKSHEMHAADNTECEQSPDDESAKELVFENLNIKKEFTECNPSGEQLNANGKFNCETCNAMFDSEKTLNFHIQKKHISGTYVFQCPSSSCALTFLQPAAVIRHLANDHKKSATRIRMMRDMILKRRIQLGNIQGKGTNSELKRCKVDEKYDETEMGRDSSEYNTQKFTAVEGDISEYKQCAISQLEEDTFKHKKPTVSKGDDVNSYHKKSFSTNVNGDKSNLLTRVDGIIMEEIKHIPTTLSEDVLAYKQSTCVEEEKDISKYKTQKLPSTVEEHKDSEHVNLPDIPMAGNSERMPSLSIKENSVNCESSHNGGETVITQHKKLALTAVNEDNKSYQNKSILSNVDKNNSEYKMPLSTSTGDEGSKQKKPIFTCPCCKRTFERRAAYSTHYLHCSAKFKGAAAKKRELAEINNSLTVKIKQEAHETEDLNEMFVNLSNKTFGAGLQTVSLDKLDFSETENTNTSKTAETDLINKVNRDEEDKKSKPAKNFSCQCKICQKQFDTVSNLRRHISMFHYRSRKFGCSICDYRAFRRYDIVNHLGFVHKITGEREALAAEYVSVHEVHYSKDDMEDDIVLITNENEGELSTNERRPKRIKLPVSYDVSASTSESESKSAPEPSTKPLQKRPIRNRIKAVYKDFVYDLAGYENDGASTTWDYKRRSIHHNSIDLPEVDANGTNTDDDYMHFQPISSIAVMVGAADRSAALAVKLGLAKAGTPPKLPTERPQFRARFTSTYNVPVIETSELDAARMNSRLLDDVFLEEMTRNRTDGFKIKPCLSLHTSSLDSLLQKMDFTMNNNSSKISNSEKNDSNETLGNSPVTTPEPLSTSVPDPVPFLDEPAHLRTSTQNLFLEPEPSIPQSSSPPPTPKKRITLVDRIIENQVKHRDSLLRAALEK